MSRVTYLLDGPLMTTVERRNAVRERMTKDLIEADVVFDESEAKRFLRGCGYAALDIELLGPEARQVTFQHRIVAREMSES